MFTHLSSFLVKPIPWIGGTLLMLSLSPLAHADEPIDRIYEQLKPRVNDLTRDAINKSTVNGLYQVTLGFDVYHVTSDGQHLITGDIIELTSGKRVAESGLDAKRSRMIASVDESDMVIFTAQGESKATITIFTDITCPYCRKLHKEVNSLNEAGVTIRYLAFPRNGIPSDGEEQLATVWCSADRQGAMTKAKNGESISAPECDSPVATHYQRGVDMGLRGTPAIVLAYGTLISGYLPAQQLIPQAIGAMP